MQHNVHEWSFVIVSIFRTLVTFYKYRYAIFVLLRVHFSGLQCQAILGPIFSRACVLQTTVGSQTVISMRGTLQLNCVRCHVVCISMVLKAHSDSTLVLHICCLQISCYVSHITVTYDFNNKGLFWLVDENCLAKIP